MCESRKIASNKENDGQLEILQIERNRELVDNGWLAVIEEAFNERQSYA